MSTIDRNRIAPFALIMTFALLLSAPSLTSSQQATDENGSASAAIAATTAPTKVNAPEVQLNQSSAEEERTAIVAAQTVEKDKITSFFVRASESKRIQLSMLVAYRDELAHAVQDLIGEKVTPLVFSVSTLPNRKVYFDPALLFFEQNGHVWQPQVSGSGLDVLPLEDGAAFGGTLVNGELHQGVILLPDWFNASEPIMLRYEDFHYLARFVSANE